MKPIDFVYVKQFNNYLLSTYPTDTHLLAKVRTGKGDPLIYTGMRNILINVVYFGTNPTSVEQNFITGTNDLLSAKAT